MGFEVIFSGICKLLEGIFFIVKSAFPTFTMGYELGSALSLILQTTGQANNFLHFIYGDSVYSIYFHLLLLIPVQYILFPVVNFAIGIIENKA